jgi:hypothetical protein
MNWKLWEHQWYEKWSAELQAHVSIAADVHDFVRHVATHDQIVHAERTATRSLERLFIRRLGDEYRAVDLLAINGHGFQAMSACANLFELAHTLGYVVNNDNAAEKWLVSENREHTPWPVKNLVNQNGQKLGWDQARCDGEYASYGFLCGFKHNNPVHVRASTVRPDPDLYLAQFALAEGANLALVAAGLMALFRLEGEQCSTTVEIANALFERAASTLPTIRNFS